MKSIKSIIVFTQLILVINLWHQTNGSPFKNNDSYQIGNLNESLIGQNFRQDTVAALPPNTSGDTSNPALPPPSQVSETPQGEQVNITTPVTSAPPIQEQIQDSEEDDKTPRPPCGNVEEEGEIDEEDSSSSSSESDSDSSDSESYEEEFFPIDSYEDGDFYSI